MENLGKRSGITDVSLINKQENTGDRNKKTEIIPHILSDHQGMRLLGLVSLREDAQNPQETESPGSLELWLGVRGHPRGDKGIGSRYRMWNSLRVDQKGNKIWSVKKKEKK